MPSLIEYDKPLFFFYVVSVAGAARREHNSSFPKNISISLIETSFVKLCSRRAAVPSWRVQNRHGHMHGPPCHVEECGGGKKHKWAACRILFADIFNFVVVFV